ncbi:poly(U)-specific endoribonuclease [Striga asiatica]|uniref:Poly(U)-specific endoribonuclease n=1 Tax=Striga asiatica TaxID=4170 RepID=A0A5A7PR51_STRAF|nr:poly(U)-specific endoribonuclease [Striga asiatica]
MDGLVKGLVNVVIGGGDDRDERHDRSRSSGAQDDRDQRDERSRSSWAQVVSGEGDDRDGSSSNTDYNAGTWNKRNDEDKNNDGWETVGKKHPKEQHKDANHPMTQEQSYRRNDEWNSIKSPRREEAKNNDGWETVGKKHPRQQHKILKSYYGTAASFALLFDTMKYKKLIHRDQWSNYKKPPNEQEYSSDAEYGADTDPSQRELSDLSEALNRLWELDVSRLVPGKDYEIDCGEGKKVYQKEDMAEGSLFSWLNEEIFRRPTYSRFCCLLDNYNPHQGYKEVVTSEERQEEEAFIEEISRTLPIKYLYKYLLAKGIVSGNYQEFKNKMLSLWFDLCGRGGTSSCSSAFEHVFVGEIKRGEQEVSGFHNWIQFYLEEAKGRVDYQGYIFPRRRGQIPDSETQLLTIQFEWNGVLKSVSSTLIGVSPEFEIAIYTLCFYLGEENNHVQLGPYPVNIKCYRLGNKIGSAFPVAES